MCYIMYKTKDSKQLECGYCYIAMCSLLHVRGHHLQSLI